MERQISTRPVKMPKTRRPDKWRGLTSCRAGQIVPVAYFPLLREDSIRGRVNMQIRMAEAVQTILNPIRVTAQAHLIPKSALARFDGSLETLNRSYMGQTLPGGGAAPAWEIAETALPQGDKGHEIYDALGIHYSPTLVVTNTDLVESYNAMVNWRRRAVSKALSQVDILSKELAPAFWDSWKFDLIKPTFDAAMMEGSVPLNVDEGTSGMVKVGPEGNAGSTPGLARNTDLTLRANSTDFFVARDADGTTNNMQVKLADGAFSISLANIATATQTRRMAQLRERYSGIPDEYLIDMLMQGLRVPPEDFREPVLLSRATAVIGQVERYATDGASLDQSVTRGIAQLSLPINTPAIETGGIVLVTIEIVPEQLYERNFDLAMSVKTPEMLPDALRDMLDPQKVEVVENRFPDAFHSQPTGIFGYAPLNHQWNRDFARVGGRYKRPIPDAFVEDRQRIWAVEKADPSLSEDFYICPDPFPHTPFADQEADPFEIVCVGNCVITGLTQFGATFEEDNDHYEKIMAQVDTDRIESVAPTSSGSADGTGSDADSGGVPAASGESGASASASKKSGSPGGNDPKSDDGEAL